MPKTGGTVTPAAPKKPSAKSAAAPTVNGSTLEIKDSRTSKTYTIPVADDAIRATELKNIKTADPDNHGLVSY
jgi:hypothetical protein